MVKDFSFDDDGGSVASAPVANTPLRKAGAPLMRKSLRKGESEAEELAAPVRLAGLEIVGFKRIRAVQFELRETGLTIIGGRNSQGKSSNLKAIECLLGGGRHIPDVPVHGEDPRATIAGELVDAEGKRYVVKRVINPDRTGGLEITRDDGTTVGRAQEFLDSMKGVLWFDPPAFLRQPAREQAETLRKLVGLDFSELDRERAKLYEQRTLVGRDRDRAKGHAESLPYWPDAPAEEATSSELASAMKEAVAHNEQLAARRMKAVQGRAHLSGLQRERDGIAEEKDEIARQIAALNEKLSRLEAKDDELAAKIEEFCPKLDRFEAALRDEAEVDVSEIAERLTDVERVNRQVRENAARLAAFDAHEAYSAEWDGLAGQISAIDAEKRRQLAAVKMPVEGLGFDEAGETVFYAGYPLSQASGAEQMRVAVCTAMMMSGGLKICLVDDGEKLDFSQLALLDKTIRELGGQVLMARVSDGDECSIIVEDGAVREAVAA